MDLFFADPSEVPLPPAEVRIQALKVDPYPDGRRLRVLLELDPFQKRPNADLILLDADGDELSSVYIIQSMTRRMELVMHLRRPASGLLTLQVELYYGSLPEPVTGEAGPASAAGPFEIERQVVDTRQVTFEIPA
jgi:hypothetical protein